MTRSPPLSIVWILPAFLAAACGPGDPTFRDRAPGERAPLTAACDPIDPSRCALPWPSNTFTVADPSTPTGLKLALERKALPSADEVAFLNLADGFSRLSPLLTAFPGSIDPSSVGGGDDTAIRLWVAQPGAPDEGAAIPLRILLVPSTSKSKGEETLVVAYPRRPLAPASDHVVVVLDSLRPEGGGSFEADRLTRLSLGLEAPQTDDERQRVAYHAPTRALLARANIDPAHVLRVWDFTTRSKEDPQARLKAMREAAIDAVKTGAVGVAIDDVRLPSDGSVLAIVQGRLTGLPEYRTADGVLSLDEAAMPKAVGVHDAPFRVMIPRGTTDYRMVLYGHGTGGSLDEDTFDEEIAADGLGKANGLFYGWDGATFPNTLIGLGRVQRGVATSSAGLMQALADVSAIEEALNGPLADALAAPLLGDVPNPAAGRRPDATAPIWTGGSLGGTLGLAYSGLSPRVQYAVLNVPGAGWTHFIPGSELFTVLAPSLAVNYQSTLDFWVTMMVSQLLWDDVDGGNWSDDLDADGSVYLLQESMGDPILPNPGSELCAAAVNAAMVGAPLQPIPGVPAPVESVKSHSAITQYRVPASEMGMAIHGFARFDTIAGEAAREQIAGFIRSALDGAPRIDLPSQCRNNTQPDSCDFSSVPP
ncbi:MAG: hypothetical protein IRZ16_01230 [Myxococcaceae bacterium]|nr:hypothetical protein [Myxococcaceae bacterium]